MRYFLSFLLIDEVVTIQNDNLKIRDDAPEDISKDIVPCASSIKAYVLVSDNELHWNIDFRSLPRP